MQSYDAIVIGAGHNGLVTAAYLAKAGKKILVVERRPNVGGIAATEEIFSGFKYLTCAHLAGSFSAQIIEDLELRRHGFELLPLDPLLFAPALDRNSLTISRDIATATEQIGRHSKTDASRFFPFCSLLKTLSRFLSTLHGLPLPDKGEAGSFNPAAL
ncbi:MAG TPA: FAD-dependent oxidoreductase, partial [Candidatus Binatia bacterium]